MEEEELEGKLWCEYNKEHYDEDEIVILNTGEPCYIEDAIYVYDEWYHESSCEIIISDISNTYVLTDECVTSYCGGRGTHEEFENSSSYHWIVYGIAYECWLHEEDCHYYVDIDDYAHIDDCESDYDGNCYYHEREFEQSSNHINDYHKSLAPKNLSRDSQFKVGIEVEKNYFDGESCVGNYIGEYEVFKGFETDSSCGVEAITHILPLSESGSENEQYVFQMFEDAREIIDEEEVNEKCGGHMTVSVKGLTCEDIYNKVRPFVPILYATNVNRLNNEYCEGDLKMDNPTRHSHSVAIGLKSNECVEFRIFDAIKNVEQLQLRYKLLFKVLDFSINDRGSWEEFLIKVKPLVTEIAQKQDADCDIIIKRARSFKKFMFTSYVNDDIKEFLCEEHINRHEKLLSEKDTNVVHKPKFDEISNYFTRVQELQMEQEIRKYRSILR